MVDHPVRWRSVLADRLESLARAGVEQLPKGAARATREESDIGVAAPPGAAPPPDHIKEVTQMPKSSAWQPLGSGTLFDAEEGPSLEISTAPTLDVLEQEVAGCTLCHELASTRTQTVFGVGNPQAQLCLLGEAPGADEDRLGEPFVGRAGQLLNKILAACKLSREDVYILNMIKCRPPGNRNPLPQELTNCRRYLERQLELIQPEFICCLGAVAAQSLLETTASIGRLRKVVHAYRDAKVVCTYHPAYLLRNPAAKKDAWEDMQLLMREMGVDL
jgi:uracil-DNA glycosylase